YMNGVIENCSTELDSMLDDTRNITLMATTSPLVSEASTTVFEDASYDWFLQKKALDGYLANLVTNKDHISQLALFCTNGNVFQSGGSLLLKGQMQEPWVIESSKTLSPRLQYFPDEQRLVYTRALYADKQCLAIVVAELDYSFIKERLMSFVSPDQLYMATYLNEMLVFENESPYEKAAISFAAIGPMLEANGSTKPITQKLRKENLILSTQNQEKGLVTIGIISYKTLIGDALRFRSLVLMIIFSSLPLIFFASWWLTARLYRNISALNKNMHAVSAGDLEIRSTITSTDEIGEMAGVFNTMMDQIESLMNQVKETEKHKRESEFAVLQSQIQPHFIYNTINSMKYYAHLKGVYEIEEVATAIVELLRAVIGQGHEFIPLSEEIHYIKQYLVIQRFKYQQEFETVWEIDESLLQHMIPKLLLQPIVENALIHGIANRKGGCITIKAYALDDGIHCSVSDNGKGMAQAEVAKLKGQAQHMSGVGISNVFRRIRMIYGEPYEGYITSYENLGTVVELWLPV
ncbi:MAG: sensor histidine kinase, partial [Spirochaetia bacterium]|nr:sensor histidine kinase [Spirochaetia bacterium]